MATTYNHVQMGVVDSKGDVSVLYPINTADDVSVDKSKNNYIPSNITNLQDFLNNIGSMAFENGNNLVFLANENDYDGQQLTSEINDSTISQASTWSSQKLNSHVERFIPTKDITLILINALPITKTSFVVNGKDNNFVQLCPTSGYIWFVDYYPVVTSDSQESGFPGTTNTISYAYQRWTGHSFGSESEKSVVYERIFMNTSWGTFHTV